MAVHLITGYRGKEHIKSQDARSFNAAMFGAGEFVMEIGNQLEASIVNNNTVRVLDGDLLMQGGHIRIETGTYEDLTIATGTAGKKRIDLIVMTYEKDAENGTETAFLEVIKGTETEGTPSDPEYVTGILAEGALKNQMPLYKVKIEGVVLSTIDSLFKTIPTYKTLAEQYALKFEAAINALKDEDIFDSMQEIKANTQKNMYAGALAVKELDSEVNKRFESHTHNYAGSDSTGGSATSAKKLDSSAGSATQPVYFKDGKPIKCTYSVGKNVPSDAVFTDTWRPTGTGANDACAGNDSRLSDARKASDVYDWAKQPTKPSYSASEVGAAPSKHTHNDIYYTKDEIDTIFTETNNNWSMSDKVEEGQRASLAVRGYSCPKLSDTCYDYVDENNVLHCKVGRVDLGSLRWVYDSSKSYFSSNLLSNSKLPTSNWEVLNNICSKFTSTSYQAIYNGAEDNTFAINSSGAIWVRSTSYTNSTTFKNSVKGTYLYYELATEQTYSVFDNNVLDTIGTCTNLLKPTLESQVIKGITVINNGDGTYTLNGSVQDADYLQLTFASLNLEVGKTYKIVGNPLPGTELYVLYYSGTVSGNTGTDKGNGGVFTVTSDHSSDLKIYYYIPKNVELNNVIIKPMLTTNLSADYNSFVPYTGSTGRLNGDVSKIATSMQGYCSYKNGLVESNLGITVNNNTYTATEDCMLVWHAITESSDYSDISVSMNDWNIDVIQSHVDFFDVQYGRIPMRKGDVISFTSNIGAFSSRISCNVYKL